MLFRSNLHIPKELDSSSLLHGMGLRAHPFLLHELGPKTQTSSSHELGLMPMSIIGMKSLYYKRWANKPINSCPTNWVLKPKPPYYMDQVWKHMTSVCQSPLQKRNEVKAPLKKAQPSKSVGPMF